MKTLTLTDPQINLVLSGLQELPFKHAAPVMREITQQIAKQNEADPGDEGEKGDEPGDD